VATQVFNLSKNALNLNRYNFLTLNYISVKLILKEKKSYTGGRGNMFQCSAVWAEESLTPGVSCRPLGLNL
jgi:hypothetical protein